ncbi:sugar transferase [Desulfovibrio mangrovi]|uniref:sugar transferase n=1 Tax=Desulfovibrio mangrovi TaxID=2976983 RepID=UPI0022481B28|nr:sugar transferase [Desulfovibrio mangrovi]UZP67600.1 sugar transferase [Desulfovibrio mangrovi]
MYREQVFVATNVAIILDGLVSIIAGYGAYYFRWYLGDGGWSMDSGLFISIVLTLMFLNSYVMNRLGFYDEDFRPPLWQALKKVVVAVGIDFSLLAMGLYLANIDGVSRYFIGMCALLCFMGFMTVRCLMFQFFKTKSGAYRVRRILLVGSTDRVEPVFEALQEMKSWGHAVIGWLTVGEQRDIPGLVKLGRLGDFDSVVADRDVDEVFFALPTSQPFNLKNNVELCKDMGLTVRILPAMFDPADRVQGLRVEDVNSIPTLTIYGTQINASGMFYKRIMDILGGVVGFMLFALMYIPIAIAIKLNDPGPVLFSQNRVGKNNRIFKLYKFRSMYMDAEARKKELMAQNEMDGHMFKMKDDPRVTKVGRFLRRTSLDEFPQFINVIRGEMSLVGTRPPTPDEVREYKKWQRRRVSMKPGITGLWQVSGRNTIRSFEEVVKLDLAYIDGWRFLRDIEILFRTVWVIMKKEGAS